MLKTHAEDLAKLIKQKEGHHNKDMTVTVSQGGERTEWRVAVTGTSTLIDALAAEHSSYSTGRYDRRRISPGEIEFY
ncbi:hypothetical protein [Anaeromyxobacter sp. PSR-1]|uniref:hypothetical protein n=1 Tax=unclassified Anaeromyxobacter TaxID=2620896 RepID=UPI0005E94846|nr:hypothetical protein [Anaeromyxobacter sp. PSR-1]GAO01628.1 hypothetical protein PSR1_00484 [Anaeromyxobacter sp. PSR-1]